MRTGPSAPRRGAEFQARLTRPTAENPVAPGKTPSTREPDRRPAAHADFQRLLAGQPVGLGLVIVGNNQDAAAKLGVTLVPLEELFRRSDMITLHTPLTPETRGIVSAQSPSALRLHLISGSEHDVEPKAPQQYQITTFDQSDISIPIPEPETPAGAANMPKPARQWLRVAEKPEDFLKMSDEITKLTIKVKEQALLLSEHEFHNGTDE